MKNAPIPKNEADRLMAVKALDILDTEPEARFDEVTKEATVRLHVPISTVTIIDKDREWYKSCQGIGMREGPRSISFCGHAMAAKDIFIVEDTLLDERFRDNPTVVNAPFIRFYAGISLYNKKDDLPVGAFCVKDTQPRKLSTEEMNIFLQLAGEAEDQLNRPPINKTPNKPVTKTPKKSK